MDTPEIEISVLSDSEQWASGHNTDKYLISEKVLEELNNGAQPYNIERDFVQGIDWIKLEDTELSIKYDRESIEDIIGTSLTLEEFNAIKTGIEYSEHLGRIINQLIEEEYTQLLVKEKLRDNVRAFGDC
jgi:hypothetical protein